MRSLLSTFAASLVLFASSSACAGAAVAKVGGKAPDFTLASTDGELKLSTLLGKGPVILAFFPKAFTGGCTQQMSSFRDLAPEWQKKGATVIGISTDDLPTLVKFKAELKVPFAMASDPEGKVAAQYGGITMGYASRANVTIGQDGTIVQIVEGGAATDAKEEVNACPLAKAP